MFLEVVITNVNSMLILNLIKERLEKKLIVVLGLLLVILSSFQTTRLDGRILTEGSPRYSTQTFSLLLFTGTASFQLPLNRYVQVDKHEFDLEVFSGLPYRANLKLAIEFWTPKCNDIIFTVVADNQIVSPRTKAVSGSIKNVFVGVRAKSSTKTYWKIEGCPVKRSASDQTLIRITHITES